MTFAESMKPLMIGASEFIAGEVGARERLRVLDVAAGHGLFGIAIARRYPNAEIVAQDWANVLETTKKNAVAAGVGDRVTTLGGDAFAVDLGTGYDVVLLTNLLHHFDRAACVQLLRKLHGTLAPGGRVMVLEFVPDEGRVSPPMPAGFSLMMLGLTPSGDTYTEREHREMLREAGFGATRAVGVPQSPQMLIVSER